MSIEAYPSPNGVLTSLIWRKTMSGGETSLSGYDNASQALSYTPGQEQVYLNGILLVRGDDYTATNGTSITGLSALAASDFIQVNCYNNFSVASVPAASLTGTVTNAQLANSAITINGSAISLGGSVTLAGDIESVTAGTGLTGGGSSGALTLGLSTPVATTNGGTGLSTFTTGDLVYASGADTLAKRSIGTTGQVLSVSGGVPAWATPVSGGWTLASTTTLSTATTSINLPSGYQMLVIYAVNYNTSGGYPTLTFNSQGGTNYRWQGIALNGSAVNTAFNGQDTSSISLSNGGSITSGAGNANNFVLQIFNPDSTTAFKNFILNDMTTDSGGGLRISNMGGFFRQTTAITTLQVNSGGTWTGGTILVYGVK